MNNLDEYWQKCLNSIEKEIEYISYRTWFKDLKTVTLTEKELILQAYDKFTVDQINSKYINLLTNIVEQHFQKPLKVSIILENEVKVIGG